LIGITNAGIPKIVVGGILLTDVIVDQLKGFCHGGFGVNFGIFVGRTGAEEGFVDAEEVGGAAVNGVDYGVFFSVYPGIETALWLWLSFLLLNFSSEMVGMKMLVASKKITW